MSWDKPARTVTMYNGYMSTLATVHPGRQYEKNGEILYSDARVLSVYELFIVMSIPLDWPVPDWVDDSFLRFVIGEGIPSKMAKDILQNLLIRIRKITFSEAVMGYPLKSVNSIESMLRYCNDSLKWNIDEEYFDDIDELTYDFSASDLGIKDEEFAKINVLKQMRPLTDNQDWAVFFVEFEGKHIDVTALRKVLNAIVPKRKNRDRMTWACDHIFLYVHMGRICC